MNPRQFVFAAAGAAVVLAALLAVQTASADHHMNSTGTGTAADNATMVEVGGGNATVQYYTYTPQVVEIGTGESVTWFNQNMFTELHTVTFVQDPNMTTDIILPFSVPEGAEFEVLPPFNAGEAITMEMPNGTAIVALNKLAFYPAAVDATGMTSYPNGTDIQYTIDSTVKAVNSGIILPPFPEQNATATDGPPEEEMMVGPPFPPVTTFTATFEEPGTYDYFCALHPWMTGQVVVN
jgi:plastocyanin